MWFAPELFQKVIEQIIKGISSVRNIADDILVYGTDTREHNVSLTQLFDRLTQKEPTLWPEKYHFHQSSITFFGFC